MPLVAAGCFSEAPDTSGQGSPGAAVETPGIDPGTLEAITNDVAGDGVTGAATDEASADFTSASAIRYAVDYGPRGLTQALGAFDGSMVKTRDLASFYGRVPTVTAGFMPYQIDGKSTWDAIVGPSWFWRDVAAYASAVSKNERAIISIQLMPTPRDGRGPDGIVGTEDDVSLLKCRQGAYDSYYASISTNIARSGLARPILRPGWEQNGLWFAWTSVGREADYAACFRRFVGIVRAQNPQAKFEFNVATSQVANNLALAFPGKGYVDFVGFDIYDANGDYYPLPEPCDQTCQFDRRKAVFDLRYGVAKQALDFARLKRRRSAISEWGLWQGGDNLYFMNKMIDLIRDPVNDIAYHVYLDTGHHVITGPTTPFPLAQARYKEAFGTAPGATVP